MSDMNEENLPPEAVPFFARYLEGQISEEMSEEEMSEEEMDAISGGRRLITTRKYPSDQEDSSSRPFPGMLQTLKYPSDSDECGNWGGRKWKRK